MTDDERKAVYGQLLVKAFYQRAVNERAVFHADRPPLTYLRFSREELIEAGKLDLTLEYDPERGDTGALTVTVTPKG